MSTSKHLATQAALAEYAGINRRTAHEWVHKPDFPKKTRWGWKTSDVDEWIAARSTDSQDPMLRGPETPALEEYRKWRAARERLSFERDIGRTRWLNEVNLLLDQLASALSKACETIQKHWGDEPVKILRDAFEDQRSLIHNTFGQDHAFSDPSANDGSDIDSVFNSEPTGSGLSPRDSQGDSRPDENDAAVRPG